MTSREERVTQNEQTARDINEQIEDAQGGSAEDRHLRMICECGYETCERVVAITVPEYKGLRATPDRFAVVPGHVIDDVERVVDETDRFVMVRKRSDEPPGNADAR